MPVPLLTTEVAVKRFGRGLCRSTEKALRRAARQSKRHGGLVAVFDAEDRHVADVQLWQRALRGMALLPLLRWVALFVVALFVAIGIGLCVGGSPASP